MTQDSHIKPNERRLFIKSYGCQMNVYDSGRMADVLGPHGFESVGGAEEADMIILNTCHIREKASEKVYSELGRLRALKDQRARAGKDTIIAVAGCVAQAEGEEIMARAPIVDMVFGPQTYHRLPEMVARVDQGETRVLDTDFPVEDKFDNLSAVGSPKNVAAFLTIQEGCDKFCTFCVVPYTRGAEFSRPLPRVLDEAQRLVAGGARELTLLGQNVNAYHGDNGKGGITGLGDLCRQLSEIEGLERIRYTTSHPRDMDDSLIEAHRDLPKLMPYLHLPIQSGSNTVLQAMNRQHDTKTYVELVERIRAARPDIALSSDFIVGFPGETDQDFEDTLALVREVTYAQAYSFKYSPRPGTPGADMETQVDEAVKSERLARLQSLLNEQQIAFNAACKGTRMSVLYEKPGRFEGQLIGRSPYLQSVHVEAPEHFIGTLEEVEIVDVKPNSLTGHRSGAAKEPAKATVHGA
ncbi:MAG: tRNA (N6-isopentenyl adenosine(37)-C2)-methylthiotransferase MiaB [Alphaproteobacteria bacterium]|nr:MAG: tRNA (N6-isopentenyl adenosine(37)-C2)-methylthiotransferase MiaB [Alphaproteobacteria bacterium]